MEEMFSLKNVPWLNQEPINLKEYFAKYSGIITSISDGKTLETKEDIRRHFPPPPPDGQEDPFDIEKLEAACNPDLLTVKDELNRRDVTIFPAKQTGRVCNWYSGSFQDKVIPQEGVETLHTLAAQAKDHHLRQSVADYARLRRKQLKYSRVVRLVTDKKDVPQPAVSMGELPNTQNDILLNVRVHRPFHKKLFANHISNPFPKFTQELLVLGSQKLTELRDSIICINDLSVNEDFSNCPDLTPLRHASNAASEFPSGFMYINKVFYSDMRHPDAKDYSEAIKLWAEKKKDIGPMTTKRMEDTCLGDLELRLGYPYVFVHLSNCEHIIVFTDARLQHKLDAQDVSRYPIQWGQPIKLATKCNICSLNQANWLVKGDPKLYYEFHHLCHRCLKTFCYDKYGKKVSSLKVFPFMDEFLQKQKK